jgi:hypothetical protein
MVIDHEIQLLHIGVREDALAHSDFHKLPFDMRDKIEALAISQSKRSHVFNAVLYGMLADSLKELHSAVVEKVTEDEKQHNNMNVYQ